MQTVLDLLARPEAQTIVIAVIAFVVGLVKKLATVKKYKLGVGIEALQVGVLTTYDIMVRGLKAGREDGKLTDEERALVRANAIQVAVEYAKDKGMDLVKFYGKELLPVLIEKIVASSKTGKAAAKALAPFSGPELPLG